MRRHPAPRTATIFISLATALFLAAGCEQVQRVFPVDAQGRDLVLHGVNISNHAKFAPGYLSWHTQADYDRLAGWGLNGVRLLIFWAAVEPAQGIYDDEYLDRIRERLDWADAAGLHVILDMHQDLYGEKFQSDGAPVWATRDDGIPYEPQTPWWLNYLEPAVLRAFHHLWNDTDLQELYAGMWAHVAERLSYHPALLGYELMNEPHFGEASPLTFENDLLFPFYRRAASAIRAVDPGRYLFFEPMIVTSAGIASFGDSIGLEAAVYAPHFYQTEVHEGEPYNGNPTLIRNTASQRSQEASRHGAPWVLTEFGVSPETEGYDLYLRDLLQSLDEQSAGWFYWGYDRYEHNGFAMLWNDGTETPITDHLVRPYPRATAGKLLRYGFDPVTRVFEMTFENRAGTTGGTEIFTAASRVYGGGFQVSSSDPDGTWSYDYDAGSQIVRVQHNPGLSEHTVTLRP